VQVVDDPDGIAVDEGGNLWVAEAVIPGNDNAPTNGGRVEVFSAAGAKWGEITFPNHRPTAVAFGGAGNKALYITANQFSTPGNPSGNYTAFLFAYETRCAGLR
jgi:sugar lactone lactonase YvrE